MNNTKKYWSKESHARHLKKLLEQIKNPDKFNTYANKKKNLDKIVDDLPRY